MFQVTRRLVGPRRKRRKILPAVLLLSQVNVPLIKSLGQIRRLSGVILMSFIAVILTKLLIVGRTSQFSGPKDRVRRLRLWQGVNLTLR